MDGQSCNPLLTDGIFDEQFSLCAGSEHSATCEVRLEFLPLSALIEEEQKTLMSGLDLDINLCQDLMSRSHVAIRCAFFSWISRVYC